MNESTIINTLLTIIVSGGAGVWYYLTKIDAQKEKEINNNNLEKDFEIKQLKVNRESRLSDLEATVKEQGKVITAQTAYIQDLMNINVQLLEAIKSSKSITEGDRLTILADEILNRLDHKKRVTDYA